MKIYFLGSFLARTQRSSCGHWRLASPHSGVVFYVHETTASLLRGWQGFLMQKGRSVSVPRNGLSKEGPEWKTGGFSGSEAKKDKGRGLEPSFRVLKDACFELSVLTHPFPLVHTPFNPLASFQGAQGSRHVLPTALQGRHQAEKGALFPLSAQTAGDTSCAPHCFRGIRSLR